MRGGEERKGRGGEGRWDDWMREGGGAGGAGQQSFPGRRGDDPEPAPHLHLVGVTAGGLQAALVRVVHLIGQHTDEPAPHLHLVGVTAGGLQAALVRAVHLIG